MKRFVIFSALALLFACTGVSAQKTAGTNNTANRLYIDVHHLPEGKVSFKDVAAAHAKDLAVEGRYGVQFLKYWVDEKKGDVYCLSSARDTATIVETHREAHGLMPQEIYEVSDGLLAAENSKAAYFLDLHTLGAGNVKASDVEKAHQKDLAVQGKYGVNFINYWVDEKKGFVMCLSQASDSSNIIQTHKEAHGLIPVSITQVKQGQ